MRARILLGAAALLFSAAGAARADGDLKRATPTSLEIRGTGAMGMLARTLAEQYMADHPQETLSIQTCGAYQGVKALIVGVADMAMGTDDVPPALQKLATDHNVKLKRTDVYRDAIAVVVHPDNPIKELTIKQLRDIFRGAVTNWKELGGHDAPIDVLTPSTTSAAYEVFKRRVLGDEAVMTPKAVTVTGKQLKETLTADGIVYVGFSMLSLYGLQAIAIEGVVPSTETIRSKKYPIVRLMSLYQLEPPTPLGERFAAYFLAPDKGEKLILESGNVPVQ